VVILGLNIAIELPVMLYQLRNVTTLEQATTALESMKTMNSPDLLTAVATFISSLMHAILRPWLAAIFVVLYFDTKAAMPDRPDD
jgi:hypothetical protein